jgi:hypothetical protein
VEGYFCLNYLPNFIDALRTRSNHHLLALKNEAKVAPMANYVPWLIMLFIWFKWMTAVAKPQLHPSPLL